MAGVQSKPVYRPRNSPDRPDNPYVAPLVLPADTDADIGPIPLLSIIPGFPRGYYRQDCRLLDPLTGETTANDINRFEVQ